VQFLQNIFYQLVSQLGYYWNKLPFRLEEYEKNNSLSQDYIVLKKQYTDLSIRTWILAKNRYDKCNVDLVHGLYFYSSDCQYCIQQGEQLDELYKLVISNGGDMILFTIDFNSSDPIIENLKIYYDIKSTPAIIINNNVLQGRLFTAAEMYSYIYNNKTHIKK
jgi:hypothetical protein